MTATVAQRLPSVDLTRTPTFHTPTFFTPDLGFDESHNVFESSFRESNAKRGQDEDVTVISPASIEAAAQAVARPAGTSRTSSAAPIISVDPLFRSLHDQGDSPLLSMSAQLMPTALLSHAAWAHGAFSAATTTAPLSIVTSAAEMVKEIGVAPSATWQPGRSRPVYLASSQEPVSPPLSAVQVTSSDAWSRASIDASCRSPLPQLFVDTSDPTTRSRYGQITPPDDSAPNSAHGTGSWDELVESSGGGDQLDAAPPVPPPPPVKGTKRRRGHGVEKEKAKDEEKPNASKRRRRGTTATSGEKVVATAKVPETKPVAAPPPPAEEVLDDGDAKRSKFLERNRVAASKCRQKKKEWTSQLESRARALQLQKDQLSLVVASLRNEVLALKGELLQHDSCGCERIRQYLHREADHLASMPVTSMPQASQSQASWPVASGPPVSTPSPTMTRVGIAVASPVMASAAAASPSLSGSTVDMGGDAGGVIDDRSGEGGSSSRRASVHSHAIVDLMPTDPTSPASHVASLANNHDGSSPNDTLLAEPREP